MGVALRSTAEQAGRTRLRVEGLAAGGRGVARREGKVWFVAGALPGDLVVARATRVRARFVESRMVELVEASPDRREPPCTIQAACGGCPWMGLGEGLQRVWKQNLIRDALQRIGHLASPELDPMRVPSAPLRYRNRTEFAVRYGGAVDPVVGFHGADPSRGVVPVERCLLQHESANRVLESVREFVGVEADRMGRREAPPAAFRLGIRRSASSGKLLITLRPGGPGSAPARRLAEWLVDRHPEIVGVVGLDSESGRRGGTRCTVLAGADGLEERVDGVDLVLPAASFLQISTEGAQALIDLVAELAHPVRGARVLDLYGGIGLYGIALARRGADRVIVCEADAQAIRAGRRAARREHVSRLRYVRAEVGEFLARSRDELRADLIVANPPRSGLGRAVAAGMRAVGAQRMILVSCDPATLARDLAGLTGAQRYRIRRVVPVDLFPQTAHVEAVALLVRESDPRRSRPAGSRPASCDSR